MLGSVVHDASHLDGEGGREEGLSLLPAETAFSPEKTTVQVRGTTVRHNEDVQGYEIHMGRTKRTGGEPFATLKNEDGHIYEDGASVDEGRIFGTYLHGLFDCSSFRHGFLNRVREANGIKEKQACGVSAREKREESYKLLASAVREHLDCEFLHDLINGQSRVISNT